MAHGTSRLPRGWDLRWGLLGCVLPDATRALLRLVPVGDPVPRGLYSLIQGSLLGTGTLVLAATVLAARPRRAFPLLAVGAATRLAADACVTRWGNGVALGVPLSFTTTSFERFWPGDSPLPLMTAIALALFVLAGRRRLFAPLAVRLRRWPAAALLLAAWLAFPLPLVPYAYRAGALSARTLIEERVGDPVALDRQPFDERLHAWTGGSYGLWPAPERRSVVSLVGVLSVPGEILVERMHVHESPPRNPAGLAARVLLALCMVIGIARGSRPAARRRPGAGEAHPAEC